MKTCLAIVALVVAALLLPGCEEKVEQREGFGASYRCGGFEWNVVPVTVDGHKYMLAVGGPQGSCAICPAAQDK